MSRRSILPWVLLLALLPAACGKRVQVTEFAIVPEPEYYVQKGRSFTLTSSTRLCFENLGRNTPTAKFIAQSLRRRHVRPAFVGSPQSDCILFSLNDTVNPELGNEGYLLRVVPEGVFMSANTEAGLLYAFETFAQMLPPDIHSTSYSRITLPECTILDRPRYGWRGCLLDVCRHFMTVNEVKRHLDLMAAYKLNRLVLHLADDQGWRLESQHYPALNSTGSWRADRSGYPWGAAPPQRPGEETPYGGYYSRREVEELVAYATGRNIEIIPAIELPSHCGALLAAHPDLGCEGVARSVAVGPCWPPAVMCAGNDTVLTFLCNVLDEVAALFPSEYIHIGCSPIATEAWERCSKCQALKRHLGLASEAELQGWLVNQVAAHLGRKGKRVMGWDEMMDCGPLPPEAVLTCARGDSVAGIAARLAQGMIAAPPEYCSFDTYQADSAYHPAAFPQYLPLRTAYRFDPLPKGLRPGQEGQVWGGMCVLWSDYTTGYDQAEYLLLPRLCAFSERLWSQPDRCSWDHFRDKIENHKARLAAEGYRCCPGSFAPIVTKTPQGDGLQVTIATEVKDTYVYYTTDGSEPTPESAVYTAPLHLPRGTWLRTMTLYHGTRREGIHDYHL